MAISYVMDLNLNQRRKGGDEVRMVLHPDQEVYSLWRGYEFLEVSLSSRLWAIAILCFTTRTATIASAERCLRDGVDWSE